MTNQSSFWLNTSSLYSLDTDDTICASIQFGRARQGWAWRGFIGGVSPFGQAGQGKAWHGKAWQGKDLFLTNKEKK